MGLLDILFPKYCVSCKKLGSYLCDNCFSFISFETHGFCCVCGKPSYDGLTHPGCRTTYTIDGVFTSVVYKATVKKLIYTFKYKPYLTDLQHVLTDLFYEGIIQNEEFYKIYQKKPYLVAVPLHRSKLKARGYNQAEILAKKLGVKLKLPYVDMIDRTKLTKTQVGLLRKERKENIKDAFSLKKKHAEILKNSSVFIVDDVVTTGSTLAEIGKLLKQHGAKEVYGLAFAQD